MAAPARRRRCVGQSIANFAKFRKPYGLGFLSADGEITVAATNSAYCSFGDVGHVHLESAHGDTMMGRASVIDFSIASSRSDGSVLGYSPLANPALSLWKARTSPTLYLRASCRAASVHWYEWYIRTAFVHFGQNRPRHRCPRHRRYKRASPLRSGSQSSETRSEG